MINLHKGKIMQANVNLELFLKNDFAILQKHIDLLEAIQTHRSITKAAQELGISYKNAWDSLNEINNKSSVALITRTKANKKNSGTELSDYGKNLINSYKSIKEIQQKLLDEICKNSNFDGENFKILKRIGLKLSARNQLLVKIQEIQKGAVNAQVIASLSSGEKLISTITLQSLKDLNLKEGDEAIFIFKAPSVMLLKSDSNDFYLSAQNQIKGKIIEAKIGAVNAEITIKTSGHQTITASITKESAINMKLGVGDNVIAIIKSSQIIIGI